MIGSMQHDHTPSSWHCCARLQLVREALGPQRSSSSNSAGGPGTVAAAATAAAAAAAAALRPASHGGGPSAGPSRTSLAGGNSASMVIGDDHWQDFSREADGLLRKLGGASAGGPPEEAAPVVDNPAASSPMKQQEEEEARQERYVSAVGQPLVGCGSAALPGDEEGDEEEEEDALRDAGEDAFEVDDDVAAPQPPSFAEDAMMMRGAAGAGLAAVAVAAAAATRDMMEVDGRSGVAPGAPEAAAAASPAEGLSGSAPLDRGDDSPMAALPEPISAGDGLGLERPSLKRLRTSMVRLAADCPEADGRTGGGALGVSSNNPQQREAAERPQPALAEAAMAAAAAALAGAAVAGPGGAGSDDILQAAPLAFASRSAAEHLPPSGLASPCLWQLPPGEHPSRQSASAPARLHFPRQWLTHILCKQVAPLPVPLHTLENAGHCYVHARTPAASALLRGGKQGSPALPYSAPCAAPSKRTCLPAKRRHARVVLRTRCCAGTGLPMSPMSDTFSLVLDTTCTTSR